MLPFARVKREPSPEPRLLFPPEARNSIPAPREREHAPPAAYPPSGARLGPGWDAHAPAATTASASAAIAPASNAGSAAHHRSWLSTVQNEPEGERSRPSGQSGPSLSLSMSSMSTSASSAGAHSNPPSSSVFPSYGAPNSLMRPNQRHAPGYTCPDCETTHTAAWRWYEGRKYCNACGLHRKANGKKRSERLIEQDKQRREDKARAEQEFLHKIDGGGVKREGSAL